MKIIILLIGISLLIALGFLFAFFWAVNDGQYDDDYTPSVRILFDEPQVNQNQNLNQKRSNAETSNKQ